MSLNRVEIKVGHNHIELAETAKKEHLFGEETHEVGPSITNIAKCAGFYMKMPLKHII